MLFINRLLVIGLLCVGMTAATTAQAGNQLFTAEWHTFSFGNELTSGTGPSEFYSGFGIPAGYQCNKLWPRCPFQSTPTTLTTNGAAAFNALGGLDPVNTATQAVNCAPWADWQGNGTNVRPAKGATDFTTAMGINPIPPLYRRPDFFTAATPSALPNLTYCNGTSTSMGGFPALTSGLTGGPGKVIKGVPAAGTWTAVTSATVNGLHRNFTFPAAPEDHADGIRHGRGTRSTSVTTSGVVYGPGNARSGVVGDFQNIYPYVYSYTYATLRNNKGVFGVGNGPGAFHAAYGKGDATIDIVEGVHKFGGTMKMLGAMTTKVCYFRNGGCSIGENNWKYDVIGATAFTTANGALASGYEVNYEAKYYHTALMQVSTVMVQGERFPWTTGKVTLKATGRGPHKTVHFAGGYDHRTSVSGKGTIQLVTPVLTRWSQPAANFETGGIGILRIKFVPEPQTWAILIAGVSLLGVGYRMRGR